MNQLLNTIKSNGLCNREVEAGLLRCTSGRHVWVEAGQVAMRPELPCSRYTLSRPYETSTQRATLSTNPGKDISSKIATIVQKITRTCNHLSMAGEDTSFLIDDSPQGTANKNLNRSLLFLLICCKDTELSASKCMVNREISFIYEAA